MRAAELIVRQILHVWQEKKVKEITMLELIATDGRNIIIGRNRWPLEFIKYYHFLDELPQIKLQFADDSTRVCRYRLNSWKELHTALVHSTARQNLNLRGGNA
jgi:hypothetical protein